jgi:polyisoprenoid-binding protein YceI
MQGPEGNSAKEILSMKLAKFVGIGAVGVVATLASVSVAMSGGDAPAPAAAVVEAPLAAGTYAVDAVHSSVAFRVKHQDVAYFYGRFNKISGSFSLNTDDAAKNSLDITIPADSIDSNNAGRDKHLKGQDFFSVAEFPNITFKSKGWKATGKVDNEQAYDVVGDLTLLGKTKEITVQVRHTGTGQGRGGEVAGLEAKFTIKRSDFGMNFMVGKGLGDDVTIMVGLEGGAK